MIIGFIGKLLVTASVVVAVYVGRRLIISANKVYERNTAELMATWKPEFGYCKECGSKRFPRVIPAGYDTSTGKRINTTIYECWIDCYRFQDD